MDTMSDETYYDEETEELVIPLSMEERQKIAERVRKELYGE